MPGLTFSCHNLRCLEVETDDGDVRGFYSAEYGFHAGDLPDGRFVGWRAQHAADQAGLAPPLE